MSYIIDIGTALPGYTYHQETFAGFYGSLAHTEEEKRKIAAVSKRSAIRQRSGILEDLDYLFGMSLSSKMSLYHREAFKLALKAIKNNVSYSKYAKKITHIIAVSCTGMQAPGIEIDLIEALSLKPTTARLNINLMGCYAAITAMKSADAICKSDPGATVLVVCVELCTLHFQKRFDDNYILSNLLFADGAASMIISSKPGKQPSFLLDSFYSRLFPKAKSEMSWEISEHGFLMNLTASIPGIIKTELRESKEVKKIAQQANNYYAIHPGGKQIVESVKSALEISPEKIAPSLKVLAQCGNMSSPSILFVLKELQAEFADKQLADIPVFGCSFGPGLAFESFNLRYV